MNAEVLMHGKSAHIWARWIGAILFVAAGILTAYLFFTPKPLVIKGTLKTESGPVVAGEYDFRIKFYNATTRTDLVHSYDVDNVMVDNEGKFTTNLPSGKDLKVATLMQVCIASTKSATPGTVTGGKTVLPSCEVSQDSKGAAQFNQTICGLTAVDQNPTNTVSWLGTKNIVYASPTKACGQDGATASVSDKDVVTPLLNTPGSLSDVLSGVDLQPGTILTVDASGDVAALPASDAIGTVVREEIAENEPLPTEITNVFNSYPTTTIEGEANTDNQTLTLSGNVLSISGGNSVTLSAGGGAEQDGVIGNEIVNVESNSGLVRVGAGTTLDPFRIGLITCANGEVIKSTGVGTWGCSTDTDTDTNTTYSAGTGLSLVGTTFNNTGVLSVAGSGAITSTGGQNPTVAFANGSTAGQFWQWDGDSWELATLVAEQDAVIGNEVTNVTGSNSGLVRSGAGTAVNPYTLAANVGNGLGITSNTIAIDSPTCSGTDKLQWTGTAFVCSADVDTDTNTTYTAGTGLSLVGTTFNNTGVLSVTASGALTSSAGQNPNIAFANGSSTGQFWQWDGDSWELATLAAEQDAIIGNEVTNITGSNSGLVRSGTGTAIDPYTLAVSAGNGLQLASGSVAVNSPTCAGTTKLQWTGTAFICSADVDTDTNTTYTADGQGIELTGTTFGLELNGATLGKSASGLALNLSNPNTWAGLQTFGVGATITAGQTLTVNGDGFTDLTGTGLVISSGSLQTTLGTSIDLSTEVTNTLPIGNGGTGLTAVGAANQLLGTNAAGTALEHKNLSSLLVAGSGISFSGTSTVTITNTGAAATCDITSNYACNGGNTLGGALTLGTNDAQSFIFETNNATKMTILSNGDVGVGVSPTEKLDVNGNIHIPTTTSSVGIIKQNGTPWIHSIGTSNFFAGLDSGNLTLTGTGNTGVGRATLGATTTGSNNTAFGLSALQSNTSGQLNVATGLQALVSNLTGTHNTATGVNALSNNTSGTLNVANGYGALETNTGSNNTALGTQTLFGNTTGTNNVAAGLQAGQTTVSANANTTGSNNTFLGTYSGAGSTTQRDNTTAIGAYATVNQADSLVLGCISGVNSCPTTTRVGIANAAPGFLLHVGSASVTSGTSVARFQNAGGTCTVTPNTAGGITCTSDQRLKKNLENFTNAIDIVKKVEIKKFNMLADAKGTPKQIGIVAQQLETVLPSLVQTDSDGYKSISYAALAPVLLQAIKEQQVQMDTLKQATWEGGIVTKDTTFKAATIFEGPARFIGDVEFSGDVTITSKLKLSGDQANQAMLPAGRNRAIVRFKGAYSKAPHITATPREFVTGPYRVTDVKPTGFVIETEQVQSKDIRFDWHAFNGR